MICSKCGQNIPEGMGACPACGASIENGTYVKKVQPFWLLSSIAALVGLVAWFLLPWINISGYPFIAKLTFFGMFDAPLTVGILFLMFFLVSILYIAVAIFSVVRSVAQKRASKANIGSGVLAILVFLSMLLELSSGTYDYIASYGGWVSIGFGVWLLLIAGIAQIVLPLFEKK